jgi:ribosomal protein S18 acetylase RimI-like enzyme
MPDFAVTLPDPAVSRLLPQDWQAYRAMRLAMLQESPRSFGGTRAQAAGFDEQLWKQRLAENVVFLASVAEIPAGSAAYSEHHMTDPGDCALLGLWVDPRFRGAGVGRALVDAVVDQARAAGRRRVVLRVVAGNDPATGLYERAGFVPTGRTVLRSDDEQADGQVVEVEMELVLEDGPALPVRP